MKKVGLHLFLFLSSIVTLFPFWWMLVAAFMPDGKAMVYPPKILPQPFTTEQFSVLFSRLNMARYFFNSLMLAIIVTAISLFLIQWQDMLLQNIVLKVKINSLNYCLVQ